MALLSILPLIILAAHRHQSTATAPYGSVGVAILHRFGYGNAYDGANPLGTMALGPDGLLYGCTENGGQALTGTLFSIDGAGKETVLHDFGDLSETENDGQYPYAGPIFVGDTLYGSTEADISLAGTIWTADTSGKEYPICISGNWSPGAPPTYVAGLLYIATGVALAGGSIFTIETNGENLIDRHDFGDPKVPDDGIGPSSALYYNEANGYLYGTTTGGGKGGQGVIYRIAPGGGDYEIIHNFQDGTVPNDGSGAIGICEGPGGTMLGICSGGGKYGGGTLYELDGETVTILHHFADPDTLNDASIPCGLCAADTDGSIWGTSRYGGSTGAGALYRYDPATGESTTMHSFGDGSVTLDGGPAFDGSQPIGGLVRLGAGEFVFTTYKGTATGEGGVFRVIYTTSSTSSLYLKSVTDSPTGVIGGTSSTGTATLSQSCNQLKGLTVTLTSSSADATVPSKVVFPIGVTNENFTITTKSVTAAVTATIAGKLNTVTRSSTLVVNPRPIAVVSSFGVSANVMGGSNGTGTVYLNISPLTPLIVKLKSASVLATVPATVTVPVGSSSASFAITTKAVTKPTQVEITATSGSADFSGELGLDGGGPTMTLSASTITGGTKTITATYNIGYFNQYPIDLTTTSDSTLVTVPGEIFIDNGASSVSFTVTVAATTTDTSILIFGIGPFEGYPTTEPTAFARFTDLAPRATLTCTNSPVKSGTPANFKLVLTGPIAAGGFSSTATPADANVYSETLKLAAGTTTYTFSLDTKTVTKSETETIKLSGFSGTGSCSFDLDAP